MELIFASNNRHKVEEIQAAIGNKISIRTLKDAGIEVEIPEPHDTLEANALEKARAIYELTRSNCFSEDTGLEVEALNGDPGVKSARYAGEEKNFQKNIEKLLDNLETAENRNARFRTVISLIWKEKKYYFEGICEGQIIHAAKGDQGFGYDPVFVPFGAQKTFAEMDISEKNRYSHRKKAADKLVSFLQNID
jgi:XTP/dITP diphosphohydrolase